jgi:hypothetical protein
VERRRREGEQMRRRYEECRTGENLATRRGKDEMEKWRGAER